MKQLLLVIATLVTISVAAQAQYDSNTVRKVASLPATCTPGTTNAVVYQGVIYHCGPSANQWLKSNPGQLPTSTYAGLPTCAAGNDGQLVRVTDKNRDVYKCYGTGGIWTSENGGKFDIRDFGAVGDNSTNDATAINAAVTAASASGGTVRFPAIPGRTTTTYRITSPIDIYAGVNYESDGGAPIQAGTPVVVIKAVGAIYAFKRSTVASGISGPSFRNLTIDNVDSTSLGAFYLDGISYGTFDHIGWLPAASLSSRQYFFRVTGGSYGAYQNQFINCSGYGNTTGALLTAFQFENAANANTVIGGMVSGFDLPVVVDATNGCQFIGFSADSGMVDVYRFQNGAQNNYVTGGRYEFAEIAISAISRTSNVVTVTHPAANYWTGQLVRIFSVSDSTFNAYQAAITVTDTTHFTYASTGSDGSSSGGYYDIGNLVAFSATSTGNTVAHPAYMAGAGSLFTDASANKNLVLAWDSSAAHTGIVGIRQAYLQTSIVGTSTLTSVAVTATSGGTTTLDLSLGNIRTVTMPAGNTTLTATNVPIGPVWISITQDSTGSRTVTWNALFLFAGGTKPILTTTASATDQFQFVCNGSTCTLQSAVYDAK